MAKKSPYETGELSDSIFLILLATLEPVHGYRIMQGVEESTDGAVKIGPATMYTTLKKLKAAGWIVEIAEDESRILYAATDEGRAVLARFRSAQAAGRLRGGAAGRGGRGEPWLDTGCAAGWPLCRSTTWRCSRT